LESIAISSTSGSSSEPPAGDSSTDSLALRAFEAYPLDFSAINLDFLAGSCSLSHIS